MQQRTTKSPSLRVWYGDDGGIYLQTELKYIGVGKCTDIFIMYDLKFDFFFQNDKFSSKMHAIYKNKCGYNLIHVRMSYIIRRVHKFM